MIRLKEVEDFRRLDRIASIVVVEHGWIFQYTVVQNMYDFSFNLDKVLLKPKSPYFNGPSLFTHISILDVEETYILTKTMEPKETLSFDGPTLYDILSTQINTYFFGLEEGEEEELSEDSLDTLTSIVRDYNSQKYGNALSDLIKFGKYV